MPLARRIGPDKAARSRGGNEHHAEEHQAAAEKNGREELVLHGAEAVAQNTEEPHECDTREWHEVQREGDPLELTRQPLTNVQRI